MAEIPAWMKSGRQGLRSISVDEIEGPRTKRTSRQIDMFDSGSTGVEDSKAAKDDVRLSSEQEKALRLGNKAIEEVTWGLKSDPFGVQAYAIMKAAGKRGFGYFMEQGLGKTKVALADFLNRYNSGLNDSMVVFTVNSMKATWLREMVDESYPFDILVWPKFDSLDGATNGKVIIINYEASFRRGGDIVFEWMRRGKPFVVFDESTALANQASKQARACLKIAAVADGQACLAGKPNPNGPHNLWGQLKAIGAPVGNYFSFRNTFCVMGGFEGRVVIGQRNTPRLVQLMKPCVFFAPKKIWAPTLPKKKDATLECPMEDKAQINAYRTMENELFVSLDECGDDVVKIKQTLNKSMKLQQISSGFIIGNDGSIHELCSGEPSKFRLLRDFINASSGKTIVFAVFVRTLGMLLKAFPGAPCALSTTSAEELEANKERFNSNTCSLPFIASSSVLKFGHTLVGTDKNPCQNVVFFENDYSLLTRSQAEDRAHRWGATADVLTYYDIVCSDIERHMIKALRRKDNLAQALLGALNKERGR